MFMIDGHLEQVPMASILERAHFDREALSCWPFLNVFTVNCPGVQASYALKNAFVLCSLLAVFL